jgi:dTDP-4-dehydrorhamnose 3,5-epimerase
MTKEILPLKAAFADDGPIIRSSGEVIDGVAVRRAKVICDERGRLGEIMRADDPWFQKFGQAYFTTTHPGVVKAWHYHTKQTDHFYILRGTVKVGLYDERKDSPTSGTVNEVYLSEHCPALLRIPPGVLHGWMCVGQTQAYVVNVVTETYNYADPDEFRVHPHDNHVPYDWTRKDG